MPYGKLKVNTLTYDNSGSDVDITVSDIPSGATLALKANVASPTFTGTPAAPTAAADTNTTQIATTAYVVGQGYLKSSTASSTYLTTSAAGSTYAPLASPTFTGTVTIPAGASISGYAALASAQSFTAAQRGAITTLTSSAGVVAIDFNTSNNFYIQLSENVSSVTVSNATAGQSGSIFIAQPASGGPYTVGGWAGAFKFSGATAPTITATNSKTDRIDYVIRASGEIQVVWTGNY